MIGKGFQENASIDEGINPGDGSRTILHFEGDSLIIQTTYDAEPWLAHVQAMRERNAGKPWGEGIEVGYLPPPVYDRFTRIQGQNARLRALRIFFRTNPKLCAYDPFLK